LRRPSRERTLEAELETILDHLDKVAIPDDLAVNGARDAVLQLEIHLRHSVFWVDGGIRNITC